MRLLPTLALSTLVLSATLLMSGCETTSYYWQAAQGQLQLNHDRHSVDELIADSTTDPDLKQQLLMTQKILSFAATTLKLPAGDSYQTYADTGRPFVVWNLFVSAEFSTQPYQWCYPIVGCLNYRGYFDNHNAKKVERSYQQQGYDTWLGGVRAYSTLGWFNDPLLNTFIHDSELQLAELIFHELSHQRVFAKGDTEFNESLATVIAQHGIKLWSTQRSLDYDPAKAEDQLRLRREFAGMIERYRQQLRGLYSSDLAPSGMRKQKQRIFNQLRKEYRQQRQTHWQDFDRFDQWINTPLNNAKLGTVSSYYRWVANLQRLLEQQNFELDKFYPALQSLADLPYKERQIALSSL